ncbi:ras-related protein Rab-40B-like protein [Lates japonicus]|uniref:Ras-related protein Rab-40B-like protein n=1 Tax=Lates japonicus TaxID=270547 RepID=A0AAD3MP96_LATJO|nr:ras-related protein Rab-40B-like protein [Lates japonicus]
MSHRTSPARAYDFLLKFLLVGDSDVGKGEILASLQDGASESPYGYNMGELLKDRALRCGSLQDQPCCCPPGASVLCYPPASVLLTRCVRIAATRGTKTRNRKTKGWWMRTEDQEQDALTYIAAAAGMDRPVVTLQCLSQTLLPGEERKTQNILILVLSLDLCDPVLSGTPTRQHGSTPRHLELVVPECFKLREAAPEPHEEVDMPASSHRPELTRTRGWPRGTITLSHTFFEAKEGQNLSPGQTGSSAFILIRRLLPCADRRLRVKSWLEVALATSGWTNHGCLLLLPLLTPTSIPYRGDNRLLEQGGGGGRPGERIRELVFSPESGSRT